MPGSLEPLDVPVQIPFHFRCPISLELMRDPVIVTTGQTYDRSSIESWVATGNTSCPVTRLPLTDFTLIPNHTLRRLIQSWCVANRSYGVERIPTPKQPADPVTVRSLLNQASSDSNSVHARLSALRRLRSLARDSEKNRSVIATSAYNARELLIEILFSTNSNPNNNSSELNLEALAILSSFQLSEPQCMLISTDTDRISYLISLLSHQSIDVKVNAASLLENVVVGTRSTEQRAEISRHNQLFNHVIELLNLSYPRAMKVGIKALFALCLVKQHRHKAVEAGAVEALINKISEFEKCDVERALATVELLCRVPEGCEAFGAHALTVPLLVKIILKVSDRATEYATGALVALCSNDERLKDEAVGVGVLTQLLLVVQSDCTERAKRKAQVLLKLLRDSWSEKVVKGSGEVFACSDVVPF